jgi:hypothetical protein
MEFVAIDVETANANMASICSIGTAAFEDGVLTNEWYSLIDPQDYFAGMNVSIPGIDESHVVGKLGYSVALATTSRTEPSLPEGCLEWRLRATAFFFRGPHVTQRSQMIAAHVSIYC